jgi:hypothetical protein
MAGHRPDMVSQKGRRRDSGPPAESVPARRSKRANPLWSVLATHVPPVVQAKLEVGAPDDEYERAADRAADQVLRMPAEGPPGPLPEDEEDLIQKQAMPSISLLQRQPDALGEGQVLPAPGGVRRQADGPVGSSGEGGSVGPSTASRIESLHGRGELLDAKTRADFETRFGRDFSRVQVHTGPDAGQLAHDLRARAFTTRQDIYFAPGRYDPQTPQGQHLLAHELTHVIQQSDMSVIHAGHTKEKRGLLQRTLEEAWALKSRYTTWWGNLDETALGRELLRLVLGGQLTLADEVLTALWSTNRDDVAYGFMLAATDAQLVRLAATTTSRRFLDRLFDELTSGSVAPEEQQQADRILQVTARATVSVGAFEAATTSRRTKIFPFRLPGFTVLNDAPIEARRERGGIWVRSFVRVLGTAEFRAETATLPTECFLQGIVLPETEVIGVRLYDQGGIIHYTTPLFLIQLANATDQQVLEKMLEAAGIGLTLGTGALAGLGVEASMAARVLLWADRAAFVLGTVTSILREHRSWLVEQFGPGFMDAVDIVYSAAAIYGIARVALEAPRIILGLRNSYRAFRGAARSRSSGFSSAEQTTIQQVTQSTDELIEQIDRIQGARSTPRTGQPRAAEPAPFTEGTTGRPATGPSPSAEPAPSGTSRTQQTPPERTPSEPTAPAAAGPRGLYRPTQAELEGYADMAWRVLGGKGPRPAVTETPLPSGRLGQYRSNPPTIEVGTGARSPSSVIGTVWHEASHGRIRQLVGFMNEHLGGSWQRTLLRPLDEMVSYFIGGLGRVIQGPTVSSRLFGILRMLGAPVSALGSMATAAEITLWAIHMVPLAAALIWAEFKIISAIREHRDPGTSQPAPTP